jgi:AcrR family transcriptional regulator
MNQDRPAIRSRRTEEEFLGELTRLLCVHGTSALSIQEMAKRLRCSRRRLYELAPTKEEIFVLVCRAVLEEKVARGFAAAEAESDAVQAVRAYLFKTLGTSGLSKAALADLDAIPDGKALFNDYQQARAAGLEKLLVVAMRSNQLVDHNPRLVSEAMLGAGQRLRDQRFLNEVGMDIASAFHAFYDIVLNGLLPASRQSDDTQVGRMAGERAADLNGRRRPRA